VADEIHLRYFWPPSEAGAKIEYLGFYASDANFKVKGGPFNTAAEVVFGVAPAKPVFASPFAVDAWRRHVLVTDVSKRNVYLLDMDERKLDSLSLAQPQEKNAGLPGGVAIVDENQVLVVDSTRGMVGRLDMQGNVLGSFGRGVFKRPTAVAVDRTRKRIAVVDPPAHRLALFSYDGEFVTYLGGFGDGEGQFNYPLDADFDDAGNLYVLDSMNFRVQRFDRDDESYRYVRMFGEVGTAEGAFSRPKSLAVSPSGHIYVTDALGHKVVVFDREGNYLLSFGRQFVAKDGRVMPGGFYMPSGIAVDDQDGIWVVDSLNRMVHHFQYLNAKYLSDHPIRPGEMAPIVTEPH